MSKPPAWKVLLWKDTPPELGDPLPFTCEDCQGVAEMPCAKLTGAKVTAVLRHNRLILSPWLFEPPRNFLPDRIECPHCGCTFTLEEPEQDEVPQ